MKISIQALVFCGLSGGLVVSGCGGSGSGGSGGSADVDQFVSSYCAEFSSCCAAAGLPSDGAQCRALYGAFAPRGSYDSAKGAACLDEIRALPDKCEATSMSPPSCENVFAQTAGTKAPGETCDTDSDCAPSAMGEVQCASDFVDGATIQQCQVQIPGKAGDSPCIATKSGNVTSFFGTMDGIPESGYVCNTADGLACDGQTLECTLIPKVGEPCGSGFGGDCEAGAHCDFASDTCKAALGVGEACMSDQDCGTSGYCDPVGKRCVARAEEGAACTKSVECESNQCTNQKCEASGLDNLGLAFVCGSN